jgi:hypothetical protein
MLSAVEGGTRLPRCVTDRSSAVSLEFRRGGRRVSEREFWRGVEGDMTKMAEKEIKRRIERLRCPIHGQAPTNTRKTRDAAGFTFTADACCDELQKQLNVAFR